MAVAAIVSTTVLPDTELEQLGQLTITASGRLLRAHSEDVVPVLAEVLAQVAGALHVGFCQLVEFTESGSVVAAAPPVDSAPMADGQSHPPVLEEWLTARLAGGEVVTSSRPDDLPPAAMDARDQGRQTGASSILGVPGSVGGQAVCALVLHTGFPRRWPQALVKRLHVLAEILGTALGRGRHERALRTSVSVMEQLNARLEADNLYLKEEIKARHDFDDIVGDTAPLRMALARVAQVAPMNSSVLLVGPTGTGKELFARALHERSRRHARPLVRVNCAALPPTLVESELFGHEKGAFTGAVGSRQGRFELADGGTIFLDEIGDLTLEVQVKFLRVLQEGEFERVGSSRTRKVDVRVIAATHHDLEVAVAEGRFRTDLYYRLNVYPIRLPSLQQRAADIPRLVWFFIHRHQRELGRHISKVPQSVMNALQQHSWPGNVRELENTVERAMIASSGDTLYLDEPFASGSRTTVGTAQTRVSDDLDTVQRVHIETILERCGWRVNGTGNAAERLGIHPNTLRFRMKKLGVRFPEGRGRALPARAGSESLHAI